MIENIDRVLERGEKIELLVDKTDRLNQQAFKFEKSVSLPNFVIHFRLTFQFFVVSHDILRIQCTTAK